MAVSGPVVGDAKQTLLTIGKIRPRGLVDGGIVDSRPQIQAAIDIAAKYSKPWGEVAESRTARQVRIVLPAGTFKLLNELVIPDDVNITIEGQDTVLTTAAGVDYALYQDAPNGRFHRVEYINLTFWRCGIRIKDQSRGDHRIVRCKFKDTSDWAIKLMAAGDVDFGSGGVVGGFIAHCEFERCGGAVVAGVRPHGGGAIFCQGDQSDNWLVFNNRFSRNFGTDVKLYSSGWRIWGNYFEGRSGWDGIEGSEPLYYERPHIHLDGAATASIDIELMNRFGNELNEARGSQPPREMIVIGPLEKTTESGVVGHLSDVRIRDNIFRGCASPGATQYRAQCAIRYNIGAQRNKVTGNYFFAYEQCLIKFAHANDHQGIGNVIIQPDVAPPSPLWNKEPSFGPLGSWRTIEGQPSTRGTQLLRNTDAIDVNLGQGNFWGTGGNVTVAKDVQGPDGVANSAYTLNKSTSGTGQILSTVNPMQAAGTELVASIWLRSGTHDVARVFVTGLNANTEPIKLSPRWKRYWLSGLATGSAMTFFIAVGLIGDAATGSIEFALPTVDIVGVPAP